MILTNKILQSLDFIAAYKTLYSTIGDTCVRLQMLLNNLSSVGTEALARSGLEFKRLSSDVAIVAV